MGLETLIMPDRIEVNGTNYSICYEFTKDNHKPDFYVAKKQHRIGI